jgi:hypothetical protein
MYHVKYVRETNNLKTPTHERTFCIDSLDTETLLTNDTVSLLQHTYFFTHDRFSQ